MVKDKRCNSGVNTRHKEINNKDEAISFYKENKGICNVVTIVDKGISENIKIGG